MKLTNEELNKIMTKADNDLDELKMRNHELYKENERLKEENKHIFANVNDDELLISNAMNYAEAQDYKSRCEKADNQLKIIMQIIKEQPTRNIEDDEWLENRLIGVVNILQNGSEE